MQALDIAAACESLWPIAGADDWDRPGFSIGSGFSEVSNVLLSVDFTDAVLDEAIASGAQFILTHHPILLKGVSSVFEENPKGHLVSRAIRAGVSVYSAHTNADIVSDGVSDTIAKKLGLIDVSSLVPLRGQTGHGRIGILPESTTLETLVSKLNEILPATARGVSASGERTLSVSKVALCGGAGDAFINDAVVAGADVYITSDLRHHVALEAGFPLIDVSHWASESLWLDTAASQLSSLCAGVSFEVSRVNTDPWIFNQGRTK